MITELIPLPSFASLFDDKEQITPETIEIFGRGQLSLPQVECSVVHRFGPGIYIREVSISAGTFAIGHHQNFEHTNIMLKGRVTILKENGTTEDLIAPFIYVGKPGRKIGYIHEDMVWQNIYATEETDIEKLEAHFLTKSASWNEHQAIQENMASLNQQVNRDDYLKMLLDVGISHEVARKQSENESDQIPFPMGSYKVMVSKSPIEGKGLFATGNFNAGDLIAPARIVNKRTPAGRYTNHSVSPNAEMLALSNGDVYLIAIHSITGCLGGNLGEEITVDYRQALIEAKKYLGVQT